MTRKGTWLVLAAFALFWNLNSMSRADARPRQREPVKNVRISSQIDVSTFHLSEEMEEILDESTRNSLGNILNGAMGVVQRFAPLNRRTVFDVPGDHVGRSLQLIVARDSCDAFLNSLVQEGASDGIGVPANSTAATICAVDSSSGVVRIFLFLFYEPTFFDELGRERGDAFARVSTFLAHEIFGKVQHCFEADRKEISQTPSRKSRLLSEVNSFQAGIDFLRRLMADPDFPSLPEKTQNDFRRLLIQERESLESWEQLLENE